MLHLDESGLGVTCRICGEGGGPVCYACTASLGPYGGRVQSALLAAVNGQRLAEQRLAIERAHVAAGLERERGLVAALAEAREAIGDHLAELRRLRMAMEAPGPAPLATLARRAPAVPAEAAREPTTVVTDPPRPEPPTVDDATQRYSLLELD